MNYDPGEYQLKEARERVHVFSSSLDKAREQEGLFEEERQKWVLSFEEKSIMIEQLERELTSTVDALNQEKEERTMVQKELMKTTWDITNLSQSMDSGNNARILKVAPYCTRNMTSDDVSDTSASNRRVLDLLQQSQGETSDARGELSKMRTDRDRLAYQITLMKHEMDRITEEREFFMETIKNNSSKLVFRKDQVTEYELERERSIRREKDLMEFMVSFEKQVSSQRDELAKATIDLQAASTHRVSLEQQIQHLINASANHESLVLSNAAIASPSSLQTRFDEMEGIAVELSHRAESAENSLKVLMGVETSISDVPPSGEYVEEREGDEDSECLSNKLLDRIDSDFDKRTSEHLQNSDKTQKENCAPHYMRQDTPFLGSSIPRYPGHEEFAMYDIVRNKVLEEFYSAHGIHPVLSINDGKNKKKSCILTSTPKPFVKKSKVKSVPCKAVGNLMTKARRKHSESLGSDNSRVNSILKTAYQLQNLSLGSDHGHTNSTGMKDIHRYGVTKRIRSSRSGSDGITLSRAIPLDNCRQNAFHSRMKECKIKGSSTSSRSDQIIKAPNQTRKIVDQRVLGSKDCSVSRKTQLTATGIFCPSSSLTRSHQLEIGGVCRTIATPPLLLKSTFSSRPKPRTEKTMGEGRPRLQVTIPSGRRPKDHLRVASF